MTSGARHNISERVEGVKFFVAPARPCATSTASELPGRVIAWTDEGTRRRRIFGRCEARGRYSRRGTGAENAHGARSRKKM